MMSDEQFDSLKELDIVKHVLDFNISSSIVRNVLDNHIRENGTWNSTHYQFLNDVFLETLKDVKYHENISRIPKVENKTLCHRNFSSWWWINKK